MKYYIVDDNKATVLTLARMIEDREFGTVIGRSTDPRAAAKEIPKLDPDIVLVDLLMENMDGIMLVRQVKQHCPDICFVMLSKVSDKSMMKKAYDAGIEFFMNKPISIIEAKKVLGNVSERIRMKRIMDNIRGLTGEFKFEKNGFTENNGQYSAVAERETLPESISHKAPINGVLIEHNNSGEQSPAGSAFAQKPSEFASEEKLQRVDILLGMLGMLGQKGTVYIRKVYQMMSERQIPYDKALLVEITGIGDITMKNLEQQMRRAIKKGLETAARIGLDDFNNEIFVIYAGYVFDFGSLREEMNYISGKAPTGGRVSITRFMEGLSLYVNCSE